MGICIARGQRQIESGDGRGNVEGNIVFLGEHGHRVGADFVSHVAIGGNAVRAHHHASDAARVQEVAGHVVGDQRGGDMVVLELPNSKARALQERAGFIGEDIYVLAGSDGRANHAQRGAIARGCQRPRVAVRKNGLPIRDQRGAVPSDAFIDGDVFQTNLDGFGNQPLANFWKAAAGSFVENSSHALDGPEEIDCRGARLSNDLADFVELRGRCGFLHPERDSHGGGHPDGWSATDDHGANGVGNLNMVGASNVNFFAREARLIDHDHARGGPLDGFDHMVRRPPEKRGELSEIESAMHQRARNGGLSLVFGPSEDAAHRRYEQHVLPGPLIFVSMRTTEDEASDHDAANRSQAADQKGHHESAEGELFGHGTDNHHQQTEQ